MSIQTHVSHNVGRTPDAAPTVRDALRSPGHPLDSSTHGFMERRFGHDFSQVRVHTGEKAAESARAMGAQAYTVGQQIVLGRPYAPGTTATRRLLAHELAHTLQQTPRSTVCATRISESHEEAEREAERVASDVVAGHNVRVVATAPPRTLHRRALADLPDFVLRRSPRIAQLMGSELLDGFALGSHAITQEHGQRLRVLVHTLVDLLREYPGGVVHITGHTDATGDEAFNTRLGQKRADEVKAFLVGAGIPVAVLAADSAGEASLRANTQRPDARNRRVEVRFQTTQRGMLLSAPELTAARRPPVEDRPAPSLFDVRDPAAPASCDTTGDCSAVSVDRLDQQPAGLVCLIQRSFDDPAGWFGALAPELRQALTSIFNRLCQYRLLRHVRLITNVEAGEKPASLLGHHFKVPGLTPSVSFTSPFGEALLDALRATGRFCTASGPGASLHAEQTSLREISGSDSMHISIGPGDQFDVHIDRSSPVLTHPGSSFCSNAPSPAALAHIGREVVPEMARKRIRAAVTGVPVLHQVGLPGLQVFPESEPTAAVPRGTPGSEPVLNVLRITLRGPVQERQRPRVVAPLSDEVERRLAAQIPRHIQRDALVPPGAVRRLEAAERAADLASPMEEASLVAAREAARGRLESFADNAHDFARDMARRMGQVQPQASGRSSFVIRLGPIYADLPASEGEQLRDQIRDIARIVRRLLGRRAAGVNRVWVDFGVVMWDLDF